MGRSSHKCPRCTRKFKMAAHLARHMNTIHSTGSRKTASASAKRSARVGRPKSVAAKRIGRSGAASMTSASLGAETSRFMNDMSAYHQNLTAQRDSLDAEIDAIAGAMAALGAGGAPARRKPGRPAGVQKKRTQVIAKSKSGRKAASQPRKGSLKDYIVRVLGTHTKPLGPNDLGSKVIKAGFKTKSKDLTKAISNTLPKMKNVKRVGFGEYLLSSR